MKKIICLCLVSLSLFAEIDMRSKMVVRGRAEIFKSADELRLTIGVVSQGETAELALAENNEKMEKVIEAIEKGGLSKGEYETSQFSLYPVWSQPPKNLEEEWMPKLVGFQVTNNLLIKTEQLQKAGELLDIAQKAGANLIENVFFALKDYRQHRQEAITLAAENAMADARMLASVTKQKLVRILDMSLDETHLNPPRIVNYAKVGVSESTPFNPGQVEVEAAVSITYEIAQ